MAKIAGQRYSEMKFTLPEVIVIAFIFGMLMIFVGKIFDPMIPTCEILV